MSNAVFPPQSFISRMTDNMFGFHGWPSVCKTDDGTLLAVCSGYRMGHVCPFGKTVLFASKDEGKTWSPPVIINDSPLDDRDAGILNLGGGRLLVTWFCHPTSFFFLEEEFRDLTTCFAPWNNGIVLAHLASYQALPEEKKQGGSYLRLSEDNGMTWGPAIRVPVSSPHGPARLSDGTILYLGKDMYARPGEVRPKSISAISSADGGRTWGFLGEVPVPAHLTEGILHEPHAIELPGGRIFGAIRVSGTHNGKEHFTVCTTYSDDGGRTWSVPKDTGWEGSPPHFMLHSSGALLCSVGRRKPPFGQRVFVSFDGGESWDREVVLCENGPDGDLGYPATVELSNGRLLTVYYQKPVLGEHTALMQSVWSL